MKNIYLFILIGCATLIGCEKKDDRLSDSYIVKKEKKDSGYYSFRLVDAEKEKKSRPSLDELIQWLDSDYEVEDTMKAYFIGYNKLMYAIAVYRNDAIPLLIKYIDTASNIESKYAACYTLHLIGIDGLVMARTYEEFNNGAARKALLGLLKKEELRELVMLLLIRDPWLSDVSQLMELLPQLPDNYWMISNGLLRYPLKDIPFNFKVPLRYQEYKIFIEQGATIAENKLYGCAIDSLQCKYDDIIVDDVLLNDYKFSFIIPPSLLIPDADDMYTYFNERNYISHNVDAIVFLESFLHLMVDYSFIGNNYSYSIVDNKLYLISPETQRELWLKWWNRQEDNYKKYLDNMHRQKDLLPIDHERAEYNEPRQPWEYRWRGTE